MFVKRNRTKAAREKIGAGHRKRHPSPLYEREWCVQKYETEGMSAIDISRLVGRTKPGVLYWLRKHGIQRRPGNRDRKYPVTKELLAKLYVGLGMSTRDIERAYGWDNTVICRTMKKMGIQARPVHGWSGKNSRYGQCGTWPYGPGFTAKVKEKVKERDGYRCQQCGNDGSAVRLCVHHIDEDKGNNELNNLLTYCSECHGKIHGKWFNCNHLQGGC